MWGNKANYIQCCMNASAREKEKAEDWSDGADGANTIAFCY